MSFIGHQDHPVERTPWEGRKRQRREEPDPERGRCPGCEGVVHAGVAKHTDGLCPECAKEGPPEDQPSGERCQEPSVTEDDLPF